MAAVMAREIRSNAAGNSRNVAVCEQRVYWALEPSGFLNVVEILYPYVWSFPQTRVIVGDLGVRSQSTGFWFWPLSVWSIFVQFPVGMVRPQQRMLSCRGTSKGGLRVAKRRTGLVTTAIVIWLSLLVPTPFSLASSWTKRRRVRKICQPLGRPSSILLAP